MERVRFADDLPVAYEDCQYPWRRLSEVLRSQKLRNIFFKTLTDNGYEIGKDQQTISASLANSSLAKHLKVKTGDALLSLTHKFLPPRRSGFRICTKLLMLVTVLNFIWRTIRSHCFFCIRIVLTP